jgi:hypothetical protein
MCVPQNAVDPSGHPTEGHSDGRPAARPQGHPEGGSGGRTVVPEQQRHLEDELTDAVPAVLEAAPADNPRPVTTDGVRGLLRAAWEGADPATAGVWPWSRHTGTPE